MAFEATRRRWTADELTQLASRQDAYLAQPRARQPTAPLTLIAKKRPKRTAPSRARRQELLVDQVVAFIEAQRADGLIITPFNLEGPLRCGIRAGLCLQSWTWRGADEFADEALQAAFKRLGAERPRWSEGQPEYAQPGHMPIDYEHCVRCGDRLEGERTVLNTGWQRRYCGAHCRENDRLHYERRAGERRTHAEYWARLAAVGQAKREQRARSCEECGTFYIPANNSQPSRYCSKKCLGAVNGRRRARFQPCERCGEHYRVSAAGAGKRFCSRACYDAAV